MKVLFRKKLIWAMAVLVFTLVIWVVNTGQKPVDYNTQVKPIFNKNCITCHGGVRRKAGFSLLFR